MKTRRFPRLAKIAIIAILAMAAAEAGAKEKASEKPSALTAAQVFADIPVSVLDLLDRSTRLDMLDYAAVDSVYEATNLLEGTSRLLTLTDTYALIEITDVSSLQIKLLPGKKGETVIMTLYTVGSPTQTADTGIEFFDSSFRPLKLSDHFPALKARDFLTACAEASASAPCRGREADGILKELEAKLPFPTYKMTASPYDATLTVDLTIPTDIDTADRDALLAHVAAPRVFTWTGSKFKLSR